MLEQRDIGFIKLKRTILEWEWYQDNNTFRLMIHLLLKSNYTVKQWQGNTVHPGELITSIGNLGKELDLSENVVRTCLKKLKKTNYIITQGTNKFTIIKIIKSSIYDEIAFTNNKQIDDPKTNKPHSTDKQITTTNKVKKVEENKESIENFKSQVFQFSSSYSQEHLNGFYEYYSSQNKQTGRRRFEDDNYWNLEDRLKKWKVINPKKEAQPFTKNR
jgi:DNA-binding transcriptional regulator YhcF (GntR family)